MADNYTVNGLTYAANEIDGVKHVRTKLQHGAEGAATDVSTESPLPIGGAAADDAAAAGNPVPIGAVYQATPDAVDNGDVGRLRMTARRALVTASDFRSTVLTPDVLIAGSIVVDDVLCWQIQAGKFGSVDGVNYGIYSALVIPMVSAGYRNCEIVFVNGSTSHDQAIAVKVYSWNNLAQLCSFILPVINELKFAISSAGAVGLGGIAGGGTAELQAFYSVPALSGVSSVSLAMYATVPTTGAFESITINRWT